MPDTYDLCTYFKVKVFILTAVDKRSQGSQVKTMTCNLLYSEPFDPLPVTTVRAGDSGR